MLWFGGLCDGTDAAKQVDAMVFKTKGKLCLLEVWKGSRWLISC